MTDIVKVELRNGYDSERAEAADRVSKTNPVMAVFIGIDVNGNKFVKDIMQGKMNAIKAETKTRFGVDFDKLNVVDIRK